MTCWQSLSRLSFCTVTLFVAILFFECAYAGRIFHFDPDQMCKDIDAASTWRDVVPLLADQVRLHISCAERTELNVLECEFFSRDWDEPLAAAGQPKTLHQRLVESIARLDVRSFSIINAYVGRENPTGITQIAVNRKKLEGLLGEESLIQIDKKLESLCCRWIKQKKKLRRDKLEQLCREWLMKQGKFSLNAMAKAINKDFNEKMVNDRALVVSKNELISVAEGLRRSHEIATKGMNSFVRYLACSEKFMTSGQVDESEVAGFCRSLALLVNGHLDAYGVGSSSCKSEKEQFCLSSIKDVLKDSVGRFHKLLTFSYEQVEEKVIDGKEWLVSTSEGRISKFLDKLSEKQKKEREFLLGRELFAGGVLSLIEEEERKKSVVKVYSRTGFKEADRRPKVARSADWHPPTEEEKAEEAAKEAVKKAKEAVGKLWERFQLIDEIKLGVDPEASLVNSSCAESSAVAVILAQLPSHKKEALLPDVPTKLLSESDLEKAFMPKTPSAWY